MSLLAVRHLAKHFSFGRGRMLRAVDDVSFDLAPREVLGIVGESGCGKSTLARMLVGLHPRTAGEMHYLGEAMPRQFTSADHRRFGRRMQMIFQDPLSSLNPRLTVSEILGESLYFRGVRDRAAREAEAGHWLAQVGLDVSALSRYPGAFSGGQQQRIGIARALAMQPELLVCDEPISALDVSIQAQVVNLLAGLREQMGLAMVFIAHDLAMVRFLADRVLVMYQGRVVESGPCAEVFAHPAHPYTQLLLASSPVPDPVIARQHLAAAGSSASAADGVPVGGCAFRPRCTLATQACAAGVPVLQDHAPSRQVACFHAGG